jgi:aspartyl protease family protein
VIPVWSAPPGTEKGDKAQADSPAAAAREKLEKMGIHVSHSGLSLADEKKLARVFNEANTLKKKLSAAAKEVQQAQGEIDQLRNELHQRLQNNVELNSQMANSTNAYTHNQLVGAINANVSRINLIQQEQEQTKSSIDDVRKKANTAREAYVQELGELRAQIDRLSERYTALKTDADAQSALADWNAASNTKLEIKPSPFYLNSVKKLDLLEKAVSSEKIPLRREGNSYYATVMINGKHSEEMILDTGASSVVLPYKVAVECGVKIDDSAVPMIATIADGSRVKSKGVLLDSVRVGKFTAEHVECMVLPPEARNAPMLLGMTFLSHFDFSIHGTELVLGKIEDDHSSSKTKKPHATKTTRKKPKTDASTNPSE